MPQASDAPAFHAKKRGNILVRSEIIDYVAVSIFHGLIDEASDG